MGEWLPSVPGSITYGLSVIFGTFSLTTIYYSEYWGFWTDGESASLNLPTIWSLSLIKRTNRSLTVKHLSYNSVSSSWSNMNLIFGSLDRTSLIHTYGYVAMLFTTVENMSSNTTWYCGEIEQVNNFKTNPTYVEFIFLMPMLTPLWILGSHLVIFAPGLCKFGPKTNAGKPQTWVTQSFWHWIKP